MKIRNDFVSNSSSCSFIIDLTHVANALTLLDVSMNNIGTISYDISNELELVVYAKNKNYLAVYYAIHDEYDSTFLMYYNDYKTDLLLDKDPDEIAWYGIHYSIENINSFGKLLLKISDKIDYIEFSCNDYDTLGMRYLRLFYDYFKRNGCNPDSRNSEMMFCQENDDLAAILATFKLDNN